MKKLTLHDIICLYLADRGDWVLSYQLSKMQTAFGWMGSSGERRARELAEDGTHEHKGVIYTVERRKVGKFAEYRVVGKPKPRMVYVERINAEGQTVRVPQLIGQGTIA